VGETGGLEQLATGNTGNTGIERGGGMYYDGTKSGEEGGEGRRGAVLD
jgi:hypothetical protein